MMLPTTETTQDEKKKKTMTTTTAKKKKKKKIKTISSTAPISSLATNQSLKTSTEFSRRYERAGDKANRHSVSSANVVSVPFRNLKVGEDLGHGAFCSVQEVEWEDMVEAYKNTSSDDEEESAEEQGSDSADEYEHEASDNESSDSEVEEDQKMPAVPKKFALKRLLPKSMSRPILQKHLRNEASILSTLNHENIVRVYGVAADKERPPQKTGEDAALKKEPASQQNQEEEEEEEVGFFFVMDRLETTLHDQIKEWKAEEEQEKKRFESEGRAASWAKRRLLQKERKQQRYERLRQRLQDAALPIARALSYLHSQGIVHRDLKCNNIGIDQNGAVKLFDFGLAKTLGEEDDKRLQEYVGTEIYMAPEMLRREMYSGKKAEVYTFGLILWELCALSKAYDGCYGNNMDVILGQVSRNAFRPSIPTAWPKPIKQLIRRCWSHTPNQRPSFDAIVQDLESMLSEK